MGVFTEALEYFESHTWSDGRGTYSGVKPCTCLWLAVAEGAKIRAGYAHSDTVKAILAEVTGTDGTLTALFGWNDSRSSRSQVKLALEAAARRETERYGGDLRVESHA